MFSALRHRTAALALGVCFILPVHASSPKPGDFANTQARHIATFFPGRMTGTPAEMLSADYIRQQFQLRQRLCSQHHLSLGYIQLQNLTTELIQHQAQHQQIDHL